MYEDWYLDQYGQYNDLFHQDFEVFSLKSQSFDTRLGQVERLETQDILRWVEDVDQHQASSGGANLRLLYGISHSTKFSGC
jgi:hypothetical protein